jgi:hypothetical protein
MNTALFLAATAVGLAAFYLLFAPLVRVYRKFRGTRVVTCPETQHAAAVDIDVARAMLSGFGPPELRLRECSRWPERRDCGQECLAQIEAAPEDCLIRSILTRWYQDKTCVICGKALGHVDWIEHKPALLAPDRKTVEWHDVPPETLPDVLGTHLPVCWNCHIAATFRRQYPELVVDRPWKHEDLHKVH